MKDLKSLKEAKYLKEINGFKSLQVKANLEHKQAYMVGLFREYS